MQYNNLAEKEVIEKTADALRGNGFEPIIVESGADALAKIKELVPAGASVMNGSSQTLQQIGFMDYLKAGEHGWNNLHTAILAETDPVKQGALRRRSAASDYYLGSVHAITENGELLFASGSGSQLPHIAFTSPNLILVAGMQKIVPTLADAFARVDDYVFPLEDQRMKDAGRGGSIISKELIFRRESPKTGRKIYIILVNEKLGF